MDSYLRDHYDYVSLDRKETTKLGDAGPYLYDHKYLVTPEYYDENNSNFSFKIFHQIEEEKK